MKAIFTCIVICVLVAGCASAPQDPDATAASAYQDYPSWTKVNATTITGDEIGILGNAHEGATGFREVYVNATGKTVSSGLSALPYPVGTIIVKESYKNSGGSKGALTSVTIMAKQGPGYDSGNSDWEYIMLNSRMKVQGQGRLGACISCHLAAENDMVFTDNR